MARYNYDIAVVGAGSAGLTAARLARWFGKRVVLIDKVRLGGDCLHYGCVPSKALIKASRVAYESRTADRIEHAHFIKATAGLTISGELFFQLLQTRLRVMAGIMVGQRPLG